MGKGLALEIQEALSENVHEYQYKCRRGVFTVGAVMSVKETNRRGRGRLDHQLPDQGRLLSPENHHRNAIAPATKPNRNSETLPSGVMWGLYCRNARQDGTFRVSNT